MTYYILIRVIANRWTEKERKIINYVLVANSSFNIKRWNAFKEEEKDNIIEYWVFKDKEIMVKNRKRLEALYNENI